METQSAEAGLLNDSEKSMTYESMDHPVTPKLSDMPLHEWVAALTHPVSGQFPMGITMRMMDSLVKRSGVIQFPSADRRRYHTIWKTIGHFAVYLSEATRRGRIQRISMGTYMGIFGKDREAQKIPSQQSLKIQADHVYQQSNGEPTHNRPSNKRKSSLPQRYLGAFTTDKRVRIPSPASDMPRLEAASVPGQTASSQDRPPSYDSIDGGSGSSTDECPVDQGSNGNVVQETKLPQEKPASCPTRFVLPQNRPVKKPRAVRSVKPNVANSPKKKTTATVSSVKKHCHAHYQLSGRGPQGRGDLDEFGLPSLAKLEPSLKDVTMSYLNSLTTNDVTRLCEKLGFGQGAIAFAREDVDGTALLLLTREDVVSSLGLKLGPALKLYRFVRTLQVYAKGIY